MCARGEESNSPPHPPPPQCLGPSNLGHANTHVLDLNWSDEPARVDVKKYFRKQLRDCKLSAQYRVCPRGALRPLMQQQQQHNICI